MPKRPAINQVDLSPQDMVMFGNFCPKGNHFFFFFFLVFWGKCPYRKALWSGFLYTDWTAGKFLIKFKCNHKKWLHT